MGLAPPPTPALGLILGVQILSKSRRKAAEFFRIFATCGAAPRGGGGAPPTTLILLRNQRLQDEASPRTHDRRHPGPFPGPFRTSGTLADQETPRGTRGVTFVVVVGCLRRARLGGV